MPNNDLAFVRVNRGAMPTWEDFNALAALVQRYRIRTGVGYLINERPGGTSLNIKSPKAVASPGWPFKVYNTSKGATGQVQINGGDGFAATLNGFVANVNGAPVNVASGSPAVYPQLSVNGDGVIYAYVTPTTAGASPVIVLTLDIYYAGSLPAADTNNPQRYAVIPIATISNYATDAHGNVSFSVGNTFNYGPSLLMYCGMGFIWQ